GRRETQAELGCGDWEDVKHTYQSLLKQLMYNSKDRINVLTILAEENMQFSKDIVSLIEAQIYKVFICP
uniref:Uncharacterized protein n=1 Tax=Melopsittacus undulatus TaxID=13146 RepID=A0A8C6K1Z9_MELUD